MEIIIAIVALIGGIILSIKLLQYLWSSGAFGFVFKFILIPIFVGIMVNVFTESMGLGIGGSLLSGAACFKIGN